MTFIDVPKPVRKEEYALAVSRMIERLSKKQGILAVYQIGNVSTPGISDLDLVAVFSDGATCFHDFRSGLSPQEKYLFVHSLFGACQSDFITAQKVSLFHNYVLLWGEGFRQDSLFAVKDEGLTSEDAVVLKRQIALEYLVRMYVNMTIERTFGVVKLRSLMLQVKALLYDCEFLGITSGPFVDVIHRWIRRREAWFAVDQRLKEVATEWDLLYKELEQCLRQSLCDHSLYLPPRPTYRLASNMRLVDGKDVAHRRSGRILPTFLAILGKRYFSLQHRLNRFEFHLPLSSESIPKIIQKQFESEKRMKEHNEKCLPHFMVLCSSLKLS